MKRKFILFLTTLMLGTAAFGVSAFTSFAEENEAEGTVEEAWEPAADAGTWEDTGAWVDAGAEETQYGGYDEYVPPAEGTPAVSEGENDAWEDVVTDESNDGESSPAQDAETAEATEAAEAEDSGEEVITESAEDLDAEPETEENTQTEDLPDAIPEETDTEIQTLAGTAVTAQADTTAQKEKNGLFTENGKIYYYKDGVKQTGLQKVDGKWFYFKESNGAAQTGFVYIDDTRYYFNPDTGYNWVGWLELAGDKYYINSKGIVSTGWKTIGDYRYYFSTKKGIMRTGWKTIDKKKYYLGDDGKASTGWRTIGNYRYYFSTKKGIMRTGWKTIDGKRYYLGKNGKARTGWKTIDGNKYYFSSKGVMQTGWKTIDGSKYNFSSKGIMRTGWKTIDGDAYYFGSNGKLRTNTVAGSSSDGYGIVDENGKRTAKVDSSAVSMLNKAQGYSSSTNWMLLVDSTTNRVGVFQGSRGNWVMKYYWKAGTGAWGTPTVKGEFTVQSKGLSFGDGFTCWYWTQFYGNYLFHSVLYSTGSMTNIVDSGLGSNVSHGCVRLDIENAKWIYDNIPYGTKVVSYNS